MIRSQKGFSFTIYLASTILVLFITTIFFLGLQRFANSAPKDELMHTFNSAINKQHTLSKHNYPFSHFGPHSTLSLVGQNQYTECELALSVLSNPGHQLENAVLPKIIKVKGSNNYCPALYNYLQNPNSPNNFVTNLRPRYLWGGSAIMGSALRFVNVFQLKQMINALSYSAIVLLCLIIGYIGRNALLICAPLALFTAYFSGIGFYSDVALGVPFLWSLLSTSIIAIGLLIRNNLLVYLCCILCGSVSAFIWLIDGHLLQSVTWIGLLTFIITQEKNALSGFMSLYQSILNVLYFFLGFIITYIIFLLMKSYYLGLNTVLESLQSGVTHRLSDSTKHIEKIDYFELLSSLWNHGFIWIGNNLMTELSNFILYSSIIVFIFAILRIVFIIINKPKDNQSLLFCSLLLLGLSAHFLLRFYIMPNHAAIHAFFIGRYIYILPALAWSLLVATFIYSTPKKSLARK